MTLPHLIAEAEAWADMLDDDAEQATARSVRVELTPEGAAYTARLLTALSAVARAADAKNPSTQ